jgi:Tol biopolymer transport system component
MTLVPGADLGPYKILGPLGAGGMGEVYRARDPRFRREVALKVLPADFASDPERLKRFEHEARAAGALNHPNILTVHDLGTADGVPYLVTELLEGETLRERMARGVPPIAKTLEWAAQIARGLAAAHEKGIVHRDLKPENLFVTKDGRAKILDFGLARRERSGVGAPGGGTLTTTLTEAGMLLGTAGYMAPEQVRGEPADGRSDLFAFGCVLYELLAGKRAFPGESAIQQMSAILSAEPPPLGEKRAEVAGPLEVLVRHCLEKEPGARFHSASDLAFALECLHGASASAPDRRHGLRLQHRAALLLALVAVLFLVSLAAMFVAGQGSSRSQAPAFHRLTYRRGFIGTARFAPDGQTVVYSAAWEGGTLQLFTTRTEGSDSRLLDLGTAELLAISAKAEMALALRPPTNNWGRTGTLARAALAGGAPRELLEGVDFADWSPDGRELMIVRTVADTARLEYPLGTVLYRTIGWISNPRLSPRGNRIAFVVHPARGDTRGSVAVVDQGGAIRHLTSEWSDLIGLAWHPRTGEIWFAASQSGSARQLFAVSSSGRQRVVMQVPGGIMLQDVSRDGRVLLAHESIRCEARALAPGDSIERDFSWLDWFLPGDISPDGSKVLFSESGEGAGPAWAVFLRATGGGPAVRLGNGRACALSPDGRWALARPQDAPPRLVLLPTGAGEAKTLEQGGIDPLEMFPARWLPDGRHVVFSGRRAGGTPRTFVQSIEGGSPLAVTPESVLGYAPTPDGIAIAATDSTGRVVLFPVRSGEPRPTAAVLTSGEAIICVAGDGRAIYVNEFQRPDRSPQLPARVIRVDMQTGRRRLVLELMPPDPVGIGPVQLPVMTADARAYVYSCLRVLSNLYVVAGLQ